MEAAANTAEKLDLPLAADDDGHMLPANTPDTSVSVSTVSQDNAVVVCDDSVEEPVLAVDDAELDINSAEKLDVPLAADDDGHMLPANIPDPDTSVSVSRVSQDNAVVACDDSVEEPVAVDDAVDINSAYAVLSPSQYDAVVIHDDTAEEPAAVSDAVDINSASATLLSAESYGEQMMEAAEISAGDSSQPETITEGKCFFLYIMHQQILLYINYNYFK